MVENASFLTKNNLTTAKNSELRLKIQNFCFIHFILLFENGHVQKACAKSYSGDGIYRHRPNRVRRRTRQGRPGRKWCFIVHFAIFLVKATLTTSLLKGSFFIDQ